MDSYENSVLDTLIVNDLLEQDRNNTRYQCNPIQKRIKSISPIKPSPVKPSPVKPMYTPENDDNRFLYLLVILLIVYIVSVIIECNNKVKLRSIIISQQA